MSRLELAAERLATALENLEKVVELGAKSQPAAPENAPRLVALEQEREELLSRIAALEEDLSSLTGITEEVEGRLDGAIGEIRAALART